MKKIACALLAGAMLLALASCGDNADTSSAPASSAAPKSSTPVSSTAPVPSKEVSSTPSRSPADDNPLNLAFKGVAIASSTTEDYVSVTGGIEALNDGDKFSRWQAGADKKLDADGNPVLDENGNEIKYLEDEEHPTWFGIQWDEAQTFDVITCEWENAHPLEDGFYVETSDDGETWKKVKFTSVRTGTTNDGAETLDADHQIDTITLKEPVTAKAVRVYCFTYYTVPEGHENAGNTKSPTSCYEIEIYNSADVEAAALASAEPTDSTVTE